MSLTKFTGNTNVISQLADIPVQTGDDLKAKFDEAETAIKNYLNNTLTTEIEQLVATEKTTLQALITALGIQIRSEISAGVQARYPVGKIIMDTENTNPATYLGFGTWELWGSGRVPVGVDSEDEDFNTVEQTGGEKEHTLTEEELPSLSGEINLAYNKYIFENATGIVKKRGTGSVVQSIAIDGQTSYDKSSEGFIVEFGGGQAHNNLQPYITCYMWKRVN